MQYLISTEDGYKNIIGIRDNIMYEVMCNPKSITLGNMVKTLKLKTRLGYRIKLRNEVLDFIIVPEETVLNTIQNNIIIIDKILLDLNK